MKSIFMRVLFCKIHCPSFICFCKPSAAAAHLYTQGQLKLENSLHVPPPVVSVVTENNASDQLSSVETNQVKEEKEKEKEEDGFENGKNQAEIVLKSCVKKPTPKYVVERKKVQWMDSLGKELVYVKEFESSETGDTDNEEDNRGCVCVIL